MLHNYLLFLFFLSSTLKSAQEDILPKETITSRFYYSIDMYDHKKMLTALEEGADINLPITVLSNTTPLEHALKLLLSRAKEYSTRTTHHTLYRWCKRASLAGWSITLPYLAYYGAQPNDYLGINLLGTSAGITGAFLALRATDYFLEESQWFYPLLAPCRIVQTLLNHKNLDLTKTNLDMNNTALKKLLNHLRVFEDTEDWLTHFFALAKECNYSC